MSSMAMAEKTPLDLERTAGSVDPVAAAPAPNPAPKGWSAWFGGPGTTIGPRIGPVLDSIARASGESDSDESGAAILHKQRALESSASIQYRTCSWQKTAALLFSEYICLAMMSFPWSYSVLGLVPGYVVAFWPPSPPHPSSALDLLAWPRQLDHHRRASLACPLHLSRPLAVLSSSPRGARCLRHWPDALRLQALGLVGHCRHVHPQQHGMSGARLGPSCVLLDASGPSVCDPR